MAKVGDKRVRNNDFEQYEECNDCKKGFWATSDYELGNWKRYCKECEKTNQIATQKEEAKLEKFIEENKEIAKKEGVPKYIGTNLVRGWWYKDVFFENENWKERIIK